ncbi:MAG: c-type cytochrome [Flavobacteriales bacterium]|nr:c-type cytochrome [Flavobacteriales bacterium]
MKKVTKQVMAFTVIFGAAMLISCGGGDKAPAEETAATPTETTVEAAPAKDGAQFFQTSGCVACHQMDAKTVGPAIKEIAKAYADEAALTSFLKGESKAIVDPAQEAVMDPQVEITKKMSAEDLQVIVSYIMSNK